MSAPKRIKASTSSLMIVRTCARSVSSFMIIWSIMSWGAPLGRLLKAVLACIGPVALKRSLIQLWFVVVTYWTHWTKLEVEFIVETITFVKQRSTWFILTFQLSAFHRLLRFSSKPIEVDALPCLSFIIFGVDPCSISDYRPKQWPFIITLIERTVRNAVYHISNVRPTSVVLIWQKVAHLCPKHFFSTGYGQTECCHMNHNGGCLISHFSVTQNGKSQNTQINLSFPKYVCFQCRSNQSQSQQEGHDANHPWLVSHKCLNCLSSWFTCSGCASSSHNRNFSPYYKNMKQVRRHHRMCHKEQYSPKCNSSCDGNC